MDRFTNAGFEFEVTDTPPSAAGPRETVIALHGFPEDRQCWAAMTPALTAAGYRVLAPDQRGYSPAAQPVSRSAYTLSRLGADVLALADAAGVERFHLLGHDWGAALAWDLAAHHPDRLLSLTALSVPHPYAFMRAIFTSSQVWRSWYMLANQLPWLPELALSSRGGEPMRRSLIRTGLDPESAARYAARASSRGAMRGPVNWYRALPFNVTPVGSVEVPTLFVWGRNDRFVSRTAAELCARHVTGPYRFEALDDASHWLPEQAPDRIAELLTTHFAATSV